METRYIVDESGKRVSVVLPVEEYERMIEELEEWEDARGRRSACRDRPWRGRVSPLGESEEKYRLRISRLQRLRYRILVGGAADKSLRRRVSPEVAQRIQRAIDFLGEDPYPPGSRKLRGREEWRVRVDAYRIIYFVDDERNVITILSVGHRRDFYR